MGQSACCSQSDDGQAPISEVKSTKATAQIPDDQCKDIIDSPKAGVPETNTMNKVAPEQVPEQVPENEQKEEAKAGEKLGQSPRDPELELTFRTDTGALKSFVFRKRPLGLDFYKRPPITIKRVKAGSDAESQGLQIGWEVYTVNGTEVKGMQIQTVIDLLTMLSSHLPASGERAKSP